MRNNAELEEQLVMTTKIFKKSWGDCMDLNGNVSVISQFILSIPLLDLGRKMNAAFLYLFYSVWVFFHGFRISHLSSW